MRIAREPQPGDGPDYHTDHAFWVARQREANVAKTYGPKEFGLLYPTFRGGEPDRIMFYPTQPAMNTLLEMETERQKWIDRGEEALIVSRQWRML